MPTIFAASLKVRSNSQHSPTASRSSGGSFSIKRRTARVVSEVTTADAGDVTNRGTARFRS
jgi:hypothetical protein